MNFPILVESPAGSVRIEKGDYIVIFPDGTCWPIKKKLFKLMFEDTPKNSSSIDADLSCNR